MGSTFGQGPSCSSHEQGGEPCMETLDDYQKIEILRLEKGILRGLWAEFEAIRWIKPIPGGVARLRRVLLYAEEQGARDTSSASDAPARLGEGCYSTLWGDSRVTVKVYEGSKSMESFRLRACELAIQHAEMPVYGYGTIHRHKGKALIAPSIALAMETLEIIDFSTTRYDDFLNRLQKMSASMFHNDLKYDNIMQKNGQPRLIDFDLAHESKIRVSVSANVTIDFDFEPFGLATPAMRTYYDLFFLSLSISGSHPWYRDILNTMKELFVELRTGFEQLIAQVPEKELNDIPLEVLVREGTIKATSIHLCDLRGNAAAHQVDASDLPCMVRSVGVYEDCSDD